LADAVEKVSDLIAIPLWDALSDLRSDRLYH
jgi:hypothetical protein